MPDWSACSTGSEGTKRNLWQANLSKYLVEKEGMARSAIDPCLYTKFEDGAEIILIVWVDDLCIGTTTQQMFEDFFERFSKEYSSTKNKARRSSESTCARPNQEDHHAQPGALCQAIRPL